MAKWGFTFNVSKNNFSSMYSGLKRNGLEAFETNRVHQYLVALVSHNDRYFFKNIIGLRGDIEKMCSLDTQHQLFSTSLYFLYSKHNCAKESLKNLMKPL